MEQLINQHGAKPTRKVAAILPGAVAAGLILGAIEIFWPDLFAKIPPDYAVYMGAALGGLGGKAAAYFRRERLT